MMRHTTLFALLLTACDDTRGADAGARDGALVDSGVAGDAGARGDAGAGDAGTMDAGMIDAGMIDGGTAIDAGMTTMDAGTPDAGIVPEIDAGVPPRSDHHIHIEIDNFCNMRVTPTEITIPADQTAYFDWHNHSVDYPVDVWMSYGGGYTDLPTGATWDEPVSHCATPLAHTEYADISTACSSFRFLIHCN